MATYLIMLSTSLFFAVYAQRAKPYRQLNAEIGRSYVAFCVLTALPFLIVTVFRYRVGADWVYIYEGGYESIRYGERGFEDPGFNLVFRIFGMITEEPYWAIAFVGLVTILFFFTAFCQQSVMLPLTVLIYFISDDYFQTLNVLRQMLAMSIFLYSVKYLKARDWKKYFLLNLIGSSFHAASFMYLPVYFLYGVRATPRRCLTVLGVSALAYPLSNILLRGLAQLMPRFNRYFGTVFDPTEFAQIDFFIALLVALVHIFYLARFPQQDREFEWMSWMIILGVEFMLFSAVIPGMYRAALGACSVQNFSFPIMFRKETDDQTGMLVIACITVVFAARMFIYAVIDRSLGVLPYRWVFFR